MLNSLAIRGKDLRRAPHWLALLAMMLQFVVSYGHLHPEDFNFLLHGHGKLTVASYNGPITNGDNVAPDIDCPVCQSMQLLSSAALPDAVRLPPPPMGYTMPAAHFATLDLTPPPHLLFDTRGPPLS
jgi:hypothetical protein